jgi:hypothetical protein
MISMSDIEEFLSNYTYEHGKHYSETSKDTFRAVFSKLLEIFACDTIKELFETRYDDVVYYLKQNKAENTARSVWFKINAACCYFGLPTKPVDISKDEIGIVGTRKEPQTELDIIRGIIETVPDSDLKAKVFLTLVTNKDRYSVRRDWTNIFILENSTKEELEHAKAVYSIKDGHFNFKILNKTKGTLEFDIDEDTRLLIERYLITSPQPSRLFSSSSKTENNRAIQFSRYMSSITKKYIGESLTSNSFRTLSSDESKRIVSEADGDITEVMDLWNEEASKKDHSLYTENMFYTIKKPRKSKDSPKYVSIGIQTDSKTNQVSDEYLMELLKNGKTLDEVKAIKSFFEF